MGRLSCTSNTADKRFCPMITAVADHQLSELNRPPTIGAAHFPIGWLCNPLGQGKGVAQASAEESAARPQTKPLHPLAPRTSVSAVARNDSAVRFAGGGGVHQTCAPALLTPCSLALCTSLSLSLSLSPAHFSPSAASVCETSWHRRCRRKSASWPWACEMQQNDTSGGLSALQKAR